MLPLTLESNQLPALKHKEMFQTAIYALVNELTKKYITVWREGGGGGGGRPNILMVQSARKKDLSVN